MEYVKKPPKCMAQLCLGACCTIWTHVQKRHQNMAYPGTPLPERGAATGTVIVAGGRFHSQSFSRMKRTGNIISLKQQGTHTARNRNGNKEISLTQLSVPPRAMIM